MSAAREDKAEQLSNVPGWLHHEVHGRGATLLLTPGFGATGRMWDEQVEAFTDRYRLVSWDLPGHGESRLPSDGMTPKGPTPDGPTAEGPTPVGLTPEGLAPEALVHAMAALLDQVGADRAVLVGLGFGGSLALRFWRAFPSRVRALILIGTIPGLRSGAARRIWNLQVEAMAASLERDGLDALEGGMEVDPTLHTDPRRLAIAARHLLTQHDEGALPWLAEIDVPVLVLVGSEDKPSLSAADYLGRVIPNARKYVIPRANHAANQHKPDAVNAIIDEFLRKSPP